MQSTSSSTRDGDLMSSALGIYLYQQEYKTTALNGGEEGNCSHIYESPTVEKRRVEQATGRVKLLIMPSVSASAASCV